MTRKILIIGTLLIVMSILAACGTAAPPSYEVAEMQAQEDSHSEEVVEPTNTPEPPTATPVPPTNTPEPPTATPVPPTNTPEPTEVPTEEEAVIGADDPLFEAISAADPVNGEQLFIMNGCLGCHTTDSSGAMLVGPGQWDLINRAGERVEGQGPYTYIFNSIINPNDYVVEGFAPNVMLATYRDMLSDEQIYDLVAYLATLHD